jgi:hypothetical protein
MLDESLIMIEVPHNDFEANQKTIPRINLVIQLPPS